MAGTATMISRISLFAIFFLPMCTGNVISENKERKPAQVTAPRDGKLGDSKYKNDIEDIQSQLQLHNELLRSILDQLSRESHESNSSYGTTYVRWGRTACPETAQLVYDGYTGKSYYSHGGGEDYQCLPRDPEWPAGAAEGIQSYSYIYGVEYQQGAGWSDDIEDNDAPCAVCSVASRSRQIMIPGKQSCPTGWTREYFGWLVSQRHDHAGSIYVCLDNDFELIPGGSENDNGGVFYQVEARCGSLQCPPYEEGKELSCVVCTQ